VAVSYRSNGSAGERPAPGSESDSLGGGEPPTITIVPRFWSATTSSAVSPVRDCYLGRPVGDDLLRTRTFDRD
jgi:hypothetical protein